MAEVLNPTGMMMSGGDGLFGGGGGGGLIGGLILGSLLRNNGNLFGGGGGDGAAAAALARDPQQAQANMSLMQGIGDIKQAVAVNSANMETSQALQSSTIQSQLSGVAAALTNTISGTKDVVNGNTVALMTQLNGIDKSIMGTGTAVIQAVNNDGDKTRALITQQYEATLNRQLQEANAAVIELRNNQALAQATRGIEVNTTNNINQAQAQTQQQQQFNALAGLISNLANDMQYIRATNQAINIGGGTQTANPTNTNSIVRT